MTSDKIKASALGLTAGLRINVLPRKNWNPSFVIMTGIAYGSQKEKRYSIDGGAEWKSDDGGGVAVCLGFSNTFYKKHMVSLGFIGVPEDFAAVYIKYGIWF